MQLKIITALLILILGTVLVSCKGSDKSIPPASDKRVTQESTELTDNEKALKPLLTLLGESLQVAIDENDCHIKANVLGQVLAFSRLIKSTNDYIPAAYSVDVLTQAELLEGDGVDSSGDDPCGVKGEGISDLRMSDANKAILLMGEGLNKRELAATK